MGRFQGLPPHPCLPACWAGWRCHPTTPVPRLQKPPFAVSEMVPAYAGIPTSGENSLPHCYALIACQVPFLFCSLVFLPLFFLIFSLCLFHGSFLRWQHPLCVFTLHSCPVSLKGVFLSFLFFIPVGFHELFCQSFYAILSLTCHSTHTHMHMHTHTQLNSDRSWSLLFVICMLSRLVRNENCWVNVASSGSDLRLYNRIQCHVFHLCVFIYTKYPMMHWASTSHLLLCSDQSLCCETSWVFCLQWCTVCLCVSVCVCVCVCVCVLSCLVCFLLAPLPRWQQRG